MTKETRLTPGNRVREALVRWADHSPWGQHIAYWIGKTAGGLQLRLRIHSTEDIPWTPLHKPLSEATVALVTTGGIHLCVDRPFDIKSDASDREIPRSAANKDLCITHDHYDRRDAIRDLNLVFPLERLLELEREGVIKRAAGVHYSFGFTREPQELIAPGRQVGAKLAHAGVDLVVLVPA